MKTREYKIKVIIYIYMAGFDKSLDVEVFGEEVAFETTKLRVSVMQYNEGQKKLQVSRENLNEESGEWRWSKLGRMTKDESEKVVKALVLEGELSCTDFTISGSLLESAGMLLTTGAATRSLSLGVLKPNLERLIRFFKNNRI